MAKNKCWSLGDPKTHKNLLTKVKHNLNLFSGYFFPDLLILSITIKPTVFRLSNILFLFLSYF